MNQAALALTLVPLLLVGCFAPGLAVVRWLKWSPLEKLNGAIGASLILTYLASFTLFIFHANSAAYWIVSGFFALLGLLNWRQARILLRRRRSRVAIVGFVVVICWEFLHLAMTRQLGGGRWTGDWFEHFDRTRFFLGELPVDFKYLGSYSLTARPPMMNVLAAFFAKQIGLSFEGYSLTFLFLNGLAFLPCCMLLRHFGRRSSRCIPILAILFMLNPSVLQNVTFTWTKALCAGFVVMGVGFYLSGLKSADPSRLIAATLALAAGILVHYSAGPFAVAIALHYLTILAQKRRRFSEALYSGVAGLLLLSTWFIYSIHTYGLRSTVHDNTTYAGVFHQSPAEVLVGLQYNSFTSLVPHIFHSCPWRWFVPIKTCFDLRDYFFTMCQTNLTMMIGSTGGIVAIILMLKLFFRRSNSRGREVKDFWLLFLILSYLLGIYTTAWSWEAFGAAHVVMQPLAIIGVTFLAARLPLVPSAVLAFVVAGLVVDYSLGIFLHFYCREQIFAPVGDVSVWMSKAINGDYGFDVREYALKLQYHFTFWGDTFAPVSSVLRCASIAGAICALALLPRLWANISKQMDGRRPTLAAEAA